MKVQTVIRLFILYGFSLGILSCSTFKKDESLSIQIQETDTFYICDVDKINTHRKEKLSDFVSDFKIVYFENSDTALFRTWKVYVTDNYIGVLHASSPFKLFDHQGKYLCDIGRVGQGPGEYKLLYSAAIHEKNNEICLAPFSGKGLLVYDLQGNFKKRVYLGDLNKAQVRYEDNGDLGLVHLAFKDRSPFLFAQIDTQDSVCTVEAGEFAIYPYDKNGNTIGYNHELWFYNNTEDFTYMNTASDTLYKLDFLNKRIVPRFTTSFSSTADAFRIYAEYPSFFLVHSYKAKVSKVVIVDKLKEKADYLEIENDFVGNLPVKFFGNVTNGWYHEIFEPYQLLELIEKRLADRDCSEADKQILNSLVKRIDENGNNILFVAKLKR